MPKEKTYKLLLRERDEMQQLIDDMMASKERFLKSKKKWKKITVSVPEKHKDFLLLIKHSDAAINLSESVQWCIDACIRIEALYGVDACYVSFHDIRLKKNQP